MLGAWFMASDMVASPVTPRGAVLYGVLIGVLTVVIRLFGGLVEGVMYAILIANAAGPLISDWTQPRIYGAGQGKGPQMSAPVQGQVGRGRTSVRQGPQVTPSATVGLKPDPQP